MQANAVHAQREVLAAEQKLLADVTAISRRVQRHRSAIICAGGFTSGLVAGFMPARLWARLGGIARTAMKSLITSRGNDVHTLLRALRTRRDAATGN